MLTLEQIAQNLMVSTDSILAQEFYKKQFLKDFRQIGNYFLKPEDTKELDAVGPVEDDGLIIPGNENVDYAANWKKYKEILSRKITLDQAFELAQQIDSNRALTAEELNEVAAFNGRPY